MLAVAIATVFTGIPERMQRPPGGTEATGLFRLWSSHAAYRSLSEVKPPPLATLFARWERAADGGHVPALRQILDRSLGPILPNLALIDVSGPVMQARYRIVGEALVRLLGRNPAGRLVEDVYSSQIAAEVYESIGRVLTQRRPTFYTREFTIVTRRFGYYRLMLPVTLHGSLDRHVVLGIYPTSADFTQAEQWQSVLEHGEALHKAEALARQWTGAAGGASVSTWFV
jgi:hypothetical protein